MTAFSLPISNFIVPVILCAVVFAGAVALYRRRRSQNERLSLALDNMSQGLNMFDAQTRIVVVNRPYLDMYALSLDLVKPGITLRELIQRRKETGLFTGDVDTYCKNIIDGLQNGKSSGVYVPASDGRIVLAKNEPLPGGGWVSTHEDVTEQRRAEEERTAAAEQEKHRATTEGAIASFRPLAERLLGSVGECAAAMRMTANVLLGSSDRTSKQAESAVHAFNEASANVESAAVAADELSRSIAEISRQLTHTSSIVGLATDEARATDDEIAGLASAAQKIGDVVMLIRTIAGQTNLLALNATIEAARAGDAGRGFAVVASEVKSLASQTAKATDEISNHISGMQQATEESVAAIKEIGATIAQISTIATTIAGAVEQQGAATQEIARNVQGVAAGTQDAAANIVKVNRGATETGSASEQVLTSAKSLSGESTRLRAELDRFMANIRAA